jgi:hypothetical protein
MNRTSSPITTLLLAVIAVLALASAGRTTAQDTQPEAVGLQATALGSAFTYQGQLKRGGSPFNGACAFQFSL